MLLLVLHDNTITCYKQNTLTTIPLTAGVTAQTAPITNAEVTAGFYCSN